MSARKTDSGSEAPRLIKHKRSKAAAPLGFVIILLTVVGFFTLVAGGTKLFYRLTDKTADKQMYATMLNPVVMLDPPNFDSPAKLNQSFVLQTSLWSIVLEGDLSGFNTDESGRILIPVADLEVKCKELYGGLATIPRISLTADGEVVTDTNINDYSTVIFEYLADYDSFAMPVMGEIGSYYPTVEAIDKDGDYLYLTVAYHPLQSSWTENTPGAGSVITTKYKVFIMQKSPSTGRYFLAGLKDPDVDL